MDIIDILRIAKEAGTAILEVYNTDFDVELKGDNSPLTLADMRANKIITKELSELYPDIPILSEEGKVIPYAERKHWELFWLVDPLDGTKEFVNRNDEFTVNIALIHNGRPTMGVVYVPVLDLFYFSKEGIGAHKLEGGNFAKLPTEDEILKKSSRLPILNLNKFFFTIVASRSHMSKETEEYVDQLRELHGKVEIISAGSSLKLCMVAEGKANVYPRFGPTMEWDTAAGQAVVEGAGGVVEHTDTDKPLRYNKENLLNPWFIVKR